MTQELPACPACDSPYTYELPPLLVCPECAHEWSASVLTDSGNASNASSATDASNPALAEKTEIRDAVGNVLADGDTVTVVKALKVKGASGSVKIGTKVRGIRLVSGVGEHDIECKIDGFGAMQLKSSVVKKVL